MYTIYADDTCIYDDTAPDKHSMAVSPKLTLSAGAAGSLSLLLPVGCEGYDSIQRLTTTLRVERDGTVIWMGRVLEESRDLWNTRSLMCEGALAYLNDTIPMIANPSLTSVLTAHNGKVAASRQIAAGTAAYGGVTADADGSTSLDIINSKLVGALGGVLRMRYPSGTPTLDWLSNYPAATGNEQTLEFGENLLDFTRHWNMGDFATYCYVRGHKDDDTGVYAASGWVTLSGDPAPATLYGRIEKYLDYSDLETNAQCISAAQTYLATQQFAAMTLEITALDLHILNPAVKSFDLLERVHVVSAPHGLDGYFAVTGIDIPLDDPGSTRYTLGYVNVAYVRRVNTLTQKQQVAEEEQREYTDAAADGALSAANDHTDAVRVVLEARDTEIEASVTAADGKAAEAKITADEIKGKVTDAQGNYTVANLKADGFHIADAAGVTLITGTMIDVDTIHVNKLYGGIVYIMVGDTVAGSLYAEAAGGLNPSALTINFEDIWMSGAASVNLPDANFVYVYVNGSRVSLAQLLGI